MVTERGKMKPFAAIIVGLLGVALIGGSILYIYMVNRGVHNPFYDVRRNMGARLLDEVNTYDLVNNYPETVEEVIHLYSILRRLIFGQIVSDEDLLFDLIGTQRMLLSNFFNDNNPHRSQWEQILEDTNELYSKNVFLYGIDVGVIFPSNEGDICIVPLTFTMINYETMYWNYFLRFEDGRWKIYDFKRVDSTFLNIIED